MQPRFVAAILTAALLTMAAPVGAQQQQSAPDPLLGQFGAIVEVAPPPPEAARLANLLSTSLAALQPQRRRRQDVYLVVASLWDDPVFEREAVQAEAILREHLGAEGRSIILSAGGQGQRQYPAATPTNISATLGHVATLMDPSEDLFVLFITSHGTSDGAASLQERQRLIASLRPISLSAMLSQAMRTKAAYDKAVAGMWGGFGLPTKRDQERSLYLLNKLESRIYDLEEKLEELKAKDAR